MDDPGRRAANEDISVELNRLRRENGILRKERDILKKATAFLPRREVEKVSVHRSGEEGFSRIKAEFLHTWIHYH